MAAANTVFNINEIFEMILLCLPIQDLISVQATSRIWRATIQDCKSLRMKLYRQPSALPEMAWIQARSIPPPFRIMSAQKIPPDQIKRLGSIADVKEDERFAIAASFNELIFHRTEPLRNRTARLTYRIAIGEQLRIHDHVRNSIFRHENKLGCDDMYLSDPPAQTVRVTWCRSSQCLNPPHPHHSAKINNSNGVTVRDLRQAVKAECPEYSCFGSMHIHFRRQPRTEHGIRSVGLLFPMSSDSAEAERAMKSDSVTIPVSPQTKKQST